MTRNDVKRAATRNQKGTTLIETLIATAICMVAMFSLATLVILSTKQAKDMGTTTTQATTLAAQKLEELMALEFTHVTTVCGSPAVPPCIDTQLCANDGTADLTCGNATNPEDGGTVVTGFADFLRNDGTATTSSAADSFFVRRWQVRSLTTFPGTVREITVWVRGRSVDQRMGRSSPTTVVSSFKGML